MPKQPDALFGLEKLIKKAFETKETTAVQSSIFVEKHRFSVLTYGMTAVIAVIMGLMYIFGYNDDPVGTAVRFGAIVPDGIINGHAYYRLFTAMFVHFGFIHFIMNGMGLLIFGTRVERYFGRIPFMFIYLFSGICGSLASLLFTRGIAAGASTAVYGLVGAVFAYTGVTRKSMDMLNKYVMLIYISTGLTLGFVTAGIDNYGHIGGLLAGIAAGYLFTKRRINKIKSNEII